MLCVQTNYFWYFIIYLWIKSILILTELTVLSFSLSSCRCLAIMSFISSSFMIFSFSRSEYCSSAMVRASSSESAFVRLASSCVANESLQKHTWTSLYMNRNSVYKDASIDIIFCSFILFAYIYHTSLALIDVVSHAYMWPWITKPVIRVHFLSNSWIHKLSIGVWFVRIVQYLVLATIWKSGIWECKKNLNIEKIIFKAVWMKFLAMHITNQKLSFDIFTVRNLQNITMEHNLYVISEWLLA